MAPGLVMKSRAVTASPQIHLPLQRVALWLDCDVCFDLGRHACPVCGSDTWVPLARCRNHIHGAREGDTPPGLTIVLASA